MASTPEFVAYAAECLGGTGEISSKKMFGEYMLYLNGKPAFLICDDTVFVKMLPGVAAIMPENAPTAPPYVSAKPHFVIENLDDRAFMEKLTRVLDIELPVPKPKKPKVK